MCSTLDSYVQTYREQDVGTSFEGSKEAQFVLAICGTITSEFAVCVHACVHACLCTCVCVCAAYMCVVPHISIA